MASGGRRLGRHRQDAHSILAVSADGTRQYETSLRIALAMVQGPTRDTPAAARYVEKLTLVPSDHLERLRRRGTVVLFAESFCAAVTGEWANARRQRPLTEAERSEWADMDTPPPDAGCFDPDLDALVLPTSRVPRDFEGPVLHEVGHALTMHAAYVAAPRRVDLLCSLTPTFVDHLAEYRGRVDADAIRYQVFEVLAEGYRLLVAGQEEHIPSAILSALAAILDGRELSEPEVRG